MIELMLQYQNNNYFLKFCVYNNNKYNNQINKLNDLKIDC